MASAATRVIRVELCYILVYVTLSTPRKIVLYVRVKYADDTVKIIE